ncbi:MAG TPA: RNA polymerase sigma factor [Rhizomicrobium sp.]
MAEKPETSRGNAEPGHQSEVAAASEVDIWFIREVLPLEAALMQFLRHNWRNKSDIDDLRQDVYVRVYEAAHKEIPRPVKPFLFTIARHLLVDHVRREHVVPIEAVADLDALDVAIDTPGPECSVIARDELRHLQVSLDRLPPRCREAVVLGRIEGLSGREIAARMGVTEATVSRQLAIGMCALANMLYGEPTDQRWRT